jgi:NADH-quinone oxidoreductase subunit C
VVARLSDVTPTATDEQREALLADLTRWLGDGVVEHHLIPGRELWVRLSAESWKPAAEALQRNGFEFFSFLSAIDWMPSPYGRGEDNPDDPPPERDPTIRQGYAGGETRFQVFARVVDLDRHLGLTLKADVADDVMAVDSWVTVYAGANWHERETNEMFGIDFRGHPDLRKMYLPGDFEGYPLRKDFPLLARMVKPWPGIVDVEPLPPTPDDEDGDGAPDAVAGEEGEPS